MFIQWIETRNKENGFMIKHSDFDRINLITAEEPDSGAYFLNALKELAHLAVGHEGAHFLNQICRVQVQTENGTFLWYCKTDPGEMKTWQQGDQLVQAPVALLDEEEIYTESDELLFSRNQKGAQWFNPEQFIPLNPATSTPKGLGFPETLALYGAFQKCFTYTLKSPDTAELEAFIKGLPEHACLLLNASALEESFDLSPLLPHLPETLQVIAVHVHADGISSKTLQKKRNGMALGA